MARANRSIRNVLPLVLLLIATVLTFLSASTAQSLRQKVEWLFAPVSDATGAMYLSLELQHSDESLTREEIAAMVAENHQLKSRVATLEMTHLKYRALFSNGTLFSRRFKPARDLPIRLIPAAVVSGDAMPYSWGRLINAGRKKNVDKDFWVTNRILLTDRAKTLPKNWFVISGTYIVGRIIESAAYSSRLQLVTDKAFRAQGQIYRVADGREVQIGPTVTRLSAQNNVLIDVVFEGDGRGGIVISDVKRSANIREGDWLATSRTNNPLLPAPVSVGRVSAVINHKDRTWVSLEVKPMVDLATMRDVMVIQPEVRLPAVEEQR